ncbi:hypothetical protein DL89DRAFT_269134 [Linderina pennispora]|uniref:RTA1-domain-containing protein n=1 Tax=Linderina pennispora TaxID=61395 RepID=A0A1Y1W350_9FUNG|nr:uncharacterized protein DL89DRAFT_269134 [Linderina pennispora]ORX67973.1 hypothetical protein DL89DRAFT_269134 [Linderina pennispora]
MTKFPTSPDTYLAINYEPNRAAAFVLGAVFYAFGCLLIAQSAVVSRVIQNVLAPLISGILGSALIVRGANVLNDVGASAMTGLHFILLARLLCLVPNTPSRVKRIAMCTGSFAAAIIFGVLAGAGYALLKGGASPDQVKVAERIIKAGVGGQFALSIIFLSVMYHYETTSDGLRRYKGWMFVIQASALLVFSRNLARLITTAFTTINSTRNSEAAAYCTDMLFTLLVVVVWAISNLPRLHYPGTTSEKRAAS